MRVPSTFTATLNLEAGAYTVTYEYEAPELDVGFRGGWSATKITDAACVEVDDDTVCAREEAARGNEEFTIDLLSDRLAELATSSEPSYDEDRFERDYGDAGFDPYLGSYSDDC